MKHVLGTVRIEPKNLTERIKQALGMLPKITEVGVDEYSAHNSIVIMDIVQSIKKIESSDPEDAIDVSSQNLPLYIHLVATAASKCDEKRAQLLRAAIASQWTTAKVMSASQIVYNNLDFESIFSTLEIMGKFKVISGQ